MATKKQKLETQRIKLLQAAINNDQSNQDIIDIDLDLDCDQLDYNNYSARFNEQMKVKHIEVSGEYHNCQSLLHFKCDKCDHEWDAIATRVQQHGCPKCYKFSKNLDKTLRMWTRTKQIIRDKAGKIIQFPKITSKVPAKLTDRFIISCHRGHKFTFTHLKLREDQWCPLCKASNSIDPSLKSRHIYSRGMNTEQKIQKYHEIAEIKGVKIISIEPVTNNFKTICIHCNETRILTPRQLCNNQYLCINKCVFGNRYSIYKTIGG